MLAAADGLRAELEAGRPRRPPRARPGTRTRLTPHGGNHDHGNTPADPAAAALDDSGASSAYGESLADIYDSLYPTSGPAVDSMVAFLQELRPAPASLLELGVGTGRLAIPLAAHGYRVHGGTRPPRCWRNSTRTTPRAKSPPQWATSPRWPSRSGADLVLTALNTFFMLPTQEQQIDCLRGIHDALADGGAAVLETYNPQVYHRLTGGDDQGRTPGAGRAAARHDPGEPGAPVRTGRPHGHGLRPAAEGARGQPVRLARRVRRDGPARGLRVIGRWADWDRSPVTDQAEKHVYVVERQTV
ncbi:class I SAM-dependent methyltransferase [Streptomyces thinghirensis]|nr:class I SAM-dependent methyltransferase [Streptomyces thinghirensis]